jgi:hypothetical protein
MDEAGTWAQSTLIVALIFASSITPLVPTSVAVATLVASAVAISLVSTSIAIAALVTAAAATCVLVKKIFRCSSHLILQGF